MAARSADIQVFRVCTAPHLSKRFFLAYSQTCTGLEPACMLPSGLQKTSFALLMALMVYVAFVGV